MDFLESSSALLPLSLILLAARAQKPATPTRTALFRSGILIGILGSVLLCFAWLTPFALIHKANGDLSNERNTLCVNGAVLSAPLVSILACFGANRSRWQLFAAGLLLGVLGWAALLSNFV
jgi:uncharacterized membrane protein HdeD (DUF308 family)